MKTLRLGVIGVGHLGQHHARILTTLPDVQLVGVADANFEQAQTVARKHDTQPFSSFWPLLDMVDAAVVAVPTFLHHQVARPFLERGIPILVEKPLTAKLAQADELVELAEKQGTILQVGHVERFNPAFEELEKRRLQPKFIECVRASSYTGRSTDIGAVLDIMIHDLDMVLALVRSPVRSIEALGVRVLSDREDLANARISFVNGCVTTLTASRVHPRQTRTMQVWSPEGFAAIDFASRKLTLAQPAESLRAQGLPLTPATRATLQNDLFRRHIPMIELDCNHGDQLTRELEEFVHSVRTGARPRVTGSDARQALAVADCILEAIRLHQWEGRADGPTGPSQVPAPLAPLFVPPDQEAAA